MTFVNTILIVDDSDDDIFFFKRALRLAKISSRVVTAKNGQEAIALLTRAAAGAKESLPLPDLMFLDINMPLATGFDVLRWFRENVESPPPVVMMLTSSDAPSDFAAAKDLGASAFYVKPMKAAALEQLGSDLHLVWRRT